jgi:hypothetical protein
MSGLDLATFVKRGVPLTTLSSFCQLFRRKIVTILNGDYILYKNELYAVDRVWAIQGRRWLGAYQVADDSQRIEIPDNDSDVKLYET